MKGELLKFEVVVSCTYEDGDCKYKNPENVRKCYGCRFCNFVNQRGAVKVTEFCVGKQNINQGDV
jgi:MinD superfamily P-loop ATPase